MPRTSRSVAQRLAAQQSAKSKKRRAPRPTDAAPAPTTPANDAPSDGVTVDQILDEVVPSEGGLRAASTPTLTTTGARTATSGAVARKPGTLGRANAPSRFGARTAVVKRRFSEYAEEYQYVWADLRRILAVAGALTALLVVLSFFID